MRRFSAAGRPPDEGPVDRAGIAFEMDQALARLRALLVNADAGDLRRDSHGARWINEQLLYHMVFGHLIVRTLPAAGPDDQPAAASGRPRVPHC